MIMVKLRRLPQHPGEQLAPQFVRERHVEFRGDRTHWKANRERSERKDCPQDREKNQPALRRGSVRWCGGIRRRGRGRVCNRGCVSRGRGSPHTTVECFRYFTEELRAAEIDAVLHQHHQAIPDREQFEIAQQFPPEREDLAPAYVAQFRAFATAATPFAISASRRRLAYQPAGW